MTQGIGTNAYTECPECGAEIGTTITITGDAVQLAAALERSDAAIAERDELLALLADAYAMGERLAKLIEQHRSALYGHPERTHTRGDIEDLIDELAQIGTVLLGMPSAQRQPDPESPDTDRADDDAE